MVEETDLPSARKFTNFLQIKIYPERDLNVGGERNCNLLVSALQHLTTNDHQDHASGIMLTLIPFKGG